MNKISKNLFANSIFCDIINQILIFTDSTCQECLPFYGRTPADFCPDVSAINSRLNYAVKIHTAVT